MVAIDQLQRKVVLPDYPQRIVSLVPSQTELLHFLGLGDRVAGITKFCVHPEEWFRTKTRVGGTKNVNMAVIAGLHPDLVIANKEENTKEDITRLADHWPVWVSNVQNLNEAFEMISGIGQITNSLERADSLIRQIDQRFSHLAAPTVGSAIYLIWKDPLMAAGPGTFIDDMMSRAGFKNALGKEYSRYPELSPEDIENLRPEWLLLSSEPFPFKGRHAADIRERFPFSKVQEVDGEMFSWYGSRLLMSTQYFSDLITNLHPSR